MSSSRAKTGLVSLGLLLLPLTLPGQPPKPAEKVGAEITVVLPADAELLFDGAPTTQKGTERVFSTPRLEAGKVFHYNLVARWKEDGKPVEEKHQVEVTEGAQVRVTFGKAPKPDTEKPAEPMVEDQEEVSSKAQPRLAAASVNFRKELGLPFQTLRTLGSRVDAARRAHDPVAMVNMASELDTAEKVAGKKASITSSALMNEAAELAALRRQETEMQAVLKVSDQITTAQNNIATMRNLIASAKQQAQADTEAARQSQEPTWTPRKVVVNNYTTQYIDIYVNGTMKGTVLPGQTLTFMIEHRWNPTTLTGYGDADASYPWKRIINGRFTKYVWNLN